MEQQRQIDLQRLRNELSEQQQLIERQELQGLMPTGEEIGDDVLVSGGNGI